ncbi:hypothetical protein [Streptomyces blattellae]|uniref:hypothetical protein n=1 Tax=Streptomyces blattellae TaxID=2569855 RepID=UPI0012B7FBB6|nr:hypothetical protein [Streptomyces blattellae]
MAVFFAGLCLGGISGGLTYGLTTDGHLAGISAFIAAVLTWLGVATLLLFDN